MSELTAESKALRERAIAFGRQHGLLGNYDFDHLFDVNTLAAIEEAVRAESDARVRELESALREVAIHDARAHAFRQALELIRNIAADGTPDGRIWGIANDALASSDADTRTAEVTPGVVLHPCHVTGTHDPDHHLTSDRVCAWQMRDIADQLLQGVNAATLPRALHENCLWCGTKKPVPPSLQDTAAKQKQWAILAALTTNPDVPSVATAEGEK